MIRLFCAMCRTETNHRVEPSNIKSMPDYKKVTCSECGEKELVPPKVLEGKVDSKTEVDSVSVDEQRQIDDGCEDGICPSR